MPVETPRTLGDLFTFKLARPKAAGSVDVTPAVQGLRRKKATGNKSESEKRREYASQGLQQFCDTYLPHHFYTGYGEHHLDMFDVIDNEPKDPHKGKRVCRIEPRKFGKTTVISLALPLKALAFKTHYFILLIGEAAGTAVSNLQTIVHELENNEKLLEDFPHLTPAKDTKGQNAKWTDDEIQLTSGATVLAKGMGSRMRGLKKRQYRPDLGIVDDPESPETAPSFVTRQRHKKWFGGTFLGLGGDKWDVYVISNLPHHDCLAADLVRSTEWDGLLWRAVNIPPRQDERYPIGNTQTDGSALWPEAWPLEKLEAYKKEPTVGDLGFAREMMNDPRDDKDKPFNTAEFTYIDPPSPEQLRSDYRFIAAFLDPAGGEKPNELKKGRRDWACIVTAGRHKDGYVDILDVVMHKKTPDKQVDSLLDVYALYKHRRIEVEENMFKNLIGKIVLERGAKRSLYPNVQVQIQIHNKVQRILGIQPIVSAGIVRFCKHIKTKVPDYFGQFDDFPGDHEDGPDATEGVIRCLEKAATVGMPTGVSKTSYYRPGASA